ncbi:MAG: SCO family protein [Alphaproteobacteria bacterium]|nr:SCO family protein [Alphaproteobacteria bacterium]
MGLLAMGWLGLDRLSPQAAPAIGQVISFPVALDLADAEGVAVRATNADGRLSLVTFGFTNCPDVCPTLLVRMTAILDALGEDAAQLRPVFVTLDPERDTADELAAYVAAFDPRIVGARGSQAQTDAAAAAFRVSYRREGEGDEAMIYHTAALFLVDADGNLAGYFRHEDALDDIVGAIRRALATAG